jgi:hypothetical protein
MNMCPALSPGDQMLSWFSASRADNSFGANDIYWTYKKNIDRVLGIR